jgi:hypothetical protein
MPSNVVLIHGYSTRSLNTYGQLPALLTANAYNAKNIFLSAWDSLNDDITCTDIANALEPHIAALEKAGLSIADTAFITHSTGAIVFRRWLLTRWSRRQPLPSHFISLAGANHGSSLAELGESNLSRLYHWVDGNTAVGAEVLQDLDYGSAFLLALNEDWLDAYNAPNPPHTLCFSLAGGNHSGLEYQLFWQTHENGCDTTIRISGANLNYRIVSFDQTAPNPALSVKTLPFTVPHLVLPTVSHIGDTGIMGGNADTAGIVFPLMKAALATNTPAQYAALAAAWSAQTAAWSAANPIQCCTTIIFSLTHPGGRNVQQSSILISDQSPAGENQTDMQAAIQRALNVSNAIEDNQPRRNTATPSSISFYVNYEKFVQTYPHTINIIIDSGTPEIEYPPTNYEIAAGSPASIQPNETIYAKITLLRQTAATYSLIPAAQNFDPAKLWPPLPQPAS